MAAVSPAQSVDRLKERGRPNAFDRSARQNAGSKRRDRPLGLGDELVERRREPGHALDGEARMLEHGAAELSRARSMPRPRRSRGLLTRASPPPPLDIVSFSTVSIVGRSLEGIVLRPNSTATCGIAPFMKARRLCLTSVNTLVVSDARL